MVSRPDPVGHVVLLPVKPPAVGKSRLLEPGRGSDDPMQRGIDDRTRRDLATAFALDTAGAALAAERVARVLVATDDAHFASLLAALGCVTVPDGDSSGLNPALRQAAAEARRRWPELEPVALCADLPALRPADLDEALGSLVPGGASYVVDAEGVGTSLYTAPHDVFDPAFGVASAAAHQAAGALAVRGELATLRRDVDDLDDLAAAARLGLGPRTAAVVRAHGLLGDRP